MKKVSSIITSIREDFNLNGISEMYFWKSEWENFDTSDKLVTVSIPYLLYRFLYMGYFIAATTANMICSTPLDLYFIFLTNISFLIQLLYATLFFVLVIFERINRSKVDRRLFGNVYPHQEPHLPWLNKIVWIFINIVNVIPFGVTLIYWSFLFEGSPDRTQCENATNYVVHAFNYVVAFIDFMIIAVPIKRSHMLFPMVAGLCYCLFSVIYEVSGGIYRPGDDYIYSILDWKNSPGMAALVSVLGVGACALVHLVLCWGLSQLRVYIANRYRDP